MKLFSTKKFAELSGVSIRTLKYWRKAGKLIPTVTGAKGAKFYSEVQLSGVQKYLKGANCTGAKVQECKTQECKTLGVQNSNCTPVEVCTPVTKETAKILGVSIRTLKRYLKNGILKPVTTRDNGYNFYSKEQVENFKGMTQTYDKPMTQNEFVTPLIHNVTPSTCDTVTPCVTPCVTPLSQVIPVTETEDTDEMTEFKQELENLPEEILEQPRFFKIAKDKRPLVKEWSNPQNQKKYNEVDGLAGFDCSGHGLAQDYFFFDFDHVMDATGKIIGTATPHVLPDFIDTRCYFERSVSGTGLHFLARPTEKYAAELPTMSGGVKATFYLDGENRQKGSPRLELFYKTAGRYCFLTGNLYHCEKNAPILRDEVADSIINKILNYIQKQNEGFEKNELPSQNTEKKTFDDSAEYDNYRALKMIECIEVAQLEYSEWLAFMSACKNLNIDYSVVDAKNAQDTARYNAKENWEHWQSLNDPSFDIETLHGLAKRFSYSEKENYREYHADKKADDGANSKGKFEKLTQEENYSLFNLPQTDLGNAFRLKNYCENDIRFLTDSCRWLTYQKNLWQDGGKDNSAIYPFALKLAKIIIQNADKENDIEEKLAAQWQQKRTFSNAIEMFKSFPSIRITEQDLNTHKNLLCCQNGVVDLQTGKLYQHDSKLLMTQCINAEYRAGYRNNKVEQFLHEILPDENTLQALLRFLGYCLTGEVSEEKALFIHGEGGNGKSVTTKTLLTLFGDYGCGFPIESILTQPRFKDGDSATPAFTKLQWRRLSISEEIPAGRKLDYAKFKILTGGDALPIRKLFQEATEIKNPTHKMIFSGNHLPELDDTHDAGILRRWIQIKFEQDFTKNPDTTLKNFLQTPDALSALLNILVENAVEWYKDGLIISEKMNQDRDNYFAENDFVAEFISEFCERDSQKSIKLKEFTDKLIKEYPSETTGLTSQALAKMIDRIPYITKRRRNKGNLLFGIGWRDTQDLNFDGEPIDDDDIPPI